MFLSYAFGNQSSIENPVLYNIIVCTLVLGGTIGISYLSFYQNRKTLPFNQGKIIVLNGMVSDRL